MGSASGFGGVILHGLSTFGFAARAILQAVGGGDPAALRYFGVRFTAPVRPGDELETRAWQVNQGPGGTAEVAFEVRNVTTDKVRCLLAWVFCADFDTFVVLDRHRWWFCEGGQGRAVQALKNLVL